MRCPTCRFENPVDFRFCGNCGNPLAAEPREPAEDALESEPVPAGRHDDRRPVTVLFAALVGSSTVAEDLEAEDRRATIRESLAQLRDPAQARGGEFDHDHEHAVVALFGASTAHEDDPDRAVAAALQMLQIVAARSAAVDLPLDLRIGIDARPVVTDSVTNSVAGGARTGVPGDGVEVARRLQEMAGPGEIYVSEPVWRRVRARYAGDHIGLVEVEDRDHRVEVYRILRSELHPGRRLSPFVGRADDLRTIERVWSDTLVQAALVVSLIGEPGVGKSRLLAEVPPRAGAVDIRLRCDGDRAFGLFLDLIEQLLDGPPSDLEDLKARAVVRGVNEEHAVLTGALLGLAGAPPGVAMADEQQRRQVFSGALQFLFSILEARPTFLVLDDLHFADRSSLDLLGFLLERLDGIPLNLVLSYRSGFERAERAALRAVSHTILRLKLLSDRESLMLARGFLGVSHLPAQLERIILARAEGNPFFIEELLQALIESGAVAVTGGAVTMAPVVTEDEIPDTLQGIILARVDRLAHRERTTIQHAAVIGRTFSADLLAAVLGDDPESSLVELARSQLVEAEGDGQWIFLHALIQEVTYDMLLVDQRRDLHRRIAEVMERNLDDGDVSLELLAYHYAEAEAREKARQYALAAAQAASERMGFAEARVLYERALALWGDGDEEGRARVQLQLGWAALISSDHLAAKSALIEAESGFRHLQMRREAALALGMLGRVYFFAGETERAAETSREAIGLLEALGPSAELVRAYVWYSILSSVNGLTQEGRQLAARGLGVADELGLTEYRANLECSVGILTVEEGDARGLDVLARATDLGGRSGDVEAVSRAHLNTVLAHRDLGRLEDGLVAAATGREVVRKLGAPAFEWTMASLEAAMLMELGRYDEALDLAAEALGPQRHLLIQPAVAWAMTARASVLLRKGRLDEASVQIAELGPVARLAGGSMFKPLALCLDAELQEARRNRAAASLAAAEAMAAVADVTAVTHQLPTLVVASRHLPADEVRPLFERVGPHLQEPGLRAAAREVQWHLDGDRAALVEAAELYAGLHEPYQEARCRRELGEHERADEIVRTYGLEAGPAGRLWQGPARI
jgi:class 3 adenylate cyclase/tetratricopeptide (TPR) repeat protein